MSSRVLQNWVLQVQCMYVYNIISSDEHYLYTYVVPSFFSFNFDLKSVLVDLSVTTPSGLRVLLA